ncbi:hypothetical protein CVT26_010204 [Gymnopilus dilepis]|uniref:Uncharacterized protein n=1 Tax=Gymnopilus dilepis TaxID=231916 RepID=A0A409W4K8_9AGAR|nr:hypothetical protein CVT26_010204 [Gymnopilus dilepis]
MNALPRSPALESAVRDVNSSSAVGGQQTIAALKRNEHAKPGPGLGEPAGELPLRTRVPLREIN